MNRRELHPGKLSVPVLHGAANARRARTWPSKSSRARLAEKVNVMHSLRHSTVDGSRPGATYELRRRRSGVWAMFRDGLYVASTGSRQRAVAELRLKLFLLALDAEAREASRARAVGLH